MKTKLFLFAAIALVVIFLVQAQTSKTYDKTITVIIKDFSEACGEDAGDAVFCLTDESGNPITERYSCSYENNTWKVGPSDLITKDWVLNPKYKGKKATLYCTKNSGGSGWLVEKVQFDVDSAMGNTKSGVEDDLAKYAGFYQFMKYRISVNRFPLNSVVHTHTGDKYLPLDKKFIGQYFMSMEYVNYFDTTKVAAFAGGFIAPPTGNLIQSVGADGSITIKNYDNYGSDASTQVMDFSVNPNAGVCGKFVPGADGHYNLVVNNATYVWSK